MHKLWFDTETTGINPAKHGILTMFFAVCDDDLNIIDEMYLQVKPEDMASIVVEPGAMEVNKIDLRSHLEDPNTHTYAKAKDLILNFLKKHKIKGKTRSFQPCGHNIDFDLNMIYSWIMSQEEWESLVHYRKLDTNSVCSFLKDVNFFPSDVGSLVSLVDYFKIPMKEAHNAKDDILMNIEVYRKIKEVMKNAKNNVGNINSQETSLLHIIER